jgi:hypothetical protein
MVASLLPQVFIYLSCTLSSSGKVLLSPLRLLLQNIGLANAEGNTALHWACLTGQQEVRCLVMVRATMPEVEHSYVVQPSCQADRAFYYEQLLLLISLFGGCWRRLTCHVGCLQAVRLLMQNGASPSALNR